MNQTMPMAMVNRSRLRSAIVGAAERAGHAAAEHVGEPAALPLVHEDQEDQEEVREDQQDLQANLHGVHG